MDTVSQPVLHETAQYLLALADKLQAGVNEEIVKIRTQRIDNPSAALTDISLKGLRAVKDQIREIASRIEEHEMLINPPPKPRFKHSCGHCQFLGVSEDTLYDLYLCNGIDGTKNILVIRYGDSIDESAYRKRHSTSSGLAFNYSKAQMDAFNTAGTRAVAYESQTAYPPKQSPASVSDLVS